jgi:IMP dehydrogenase/GMP reductase
MQVGGLGFIHYNCSIADQVAMVAKVKAHAPGFVVNPVCLKPSDPISTFDNIKVSSSDESKTHDKSAKHIIASWHSHLISNSGHQGGRNCAA